MVVQPRGFVHPRGSPCSAISRPASSASSAAVQWYGKSGCRVMIQISWSDPAVLGWRAAAAYRPWLETTASVENTGNPDLVGRVLVPIEHTRSAPLGTPSTTRNAGRCSTTCSSLEAFSPASAAFDVLECSSFVACVVPTLHAAAGCRCLSYTSGTKRPCWSTGSGFY